MGKQCLEGDSERGLAEEKEIVATVMQKKEKEPRGHPLLSEPSAAHTARPPCRPEPWPCICPPGLLSARGMPQERSDVPVGAAYGSGSVYLGTLSVCRVEGLMLWCLHFSQKCGEVKPSVSLNYPFRRLTVYSVFVCMWKHSLTVSF